MVQSIITVLYMCQDALSRGTRQLRIDWALILSDGPIVALLSIDWLQFEIKKLMQLYEMGIQIQTAVHSERGRVPVNGVSANKPRKLRPRIIVARCM